MDREFTVFTTLKNSSKSCCGMINVVFVFNVERPYSKYVGKDYLQTGVAANQKSSLIKIRFDCMCMQIPLQRHRGLHMHSVRCWSCGRISTLASTCLGKPGTVSQHAHIRITYFPQKDHLSNIAGSYVDFVSMVCTNIPAADGFRLMVNPREHMISP